LKLLVKSTVVVARAPEALFERGPPLCPACENMVDFGLAADEEKDEG